MKKVILALIFTLTGIVGAQAQRNTLLVYGTVGFDSQKTGDAKINSFNFSPGLGYQWNNNWTGGVNLSVGNEKTSTDKTSAFAVGPFIRYAQPLNDIFAVYGQLNTNYVSGKVDNVSVSGFGASLIPAIGVNLKNSFALNFTFGSLNFNSVKSDGAANTTTDFGLSFGSGAGFGISKNFGLKK